MAASRRAQRPGPTERLVHARQALGAPRKWARLQQPLAAVARGRHRRLNEPRRGRVIGARHVGHAPAVALQSTASLRNASNMQHIPDATSLHTCSTGTALDKYSHTHSTRTWDERARSHSACTGWKRPSTPCRRSAPGRASAARRPRRAARAAAGTPLGRPSRARRAAPRIRRARAPACWQSSSQCRPRRRRPAPSAARRGRASGTPGAAAACSTSRRAPSARALRPCCPSQASHTGRHLHPALSIAAPTHLRLSPCRPGVARGLHVYVAAGRPHLAALALGPARRAAHGVEQKRLVALRFRAARLGASTACALTHHFAKGITV
jgi:hypothetical protein